MSTQHLVDMANQIAIAFAHLGEADAVAATEDHIRKFWDPRMRKRLAAALDADVSTLDPVAMKAAERLRAQ